MRRVGKIVVERNKCFSNGIFVFLGGPYPIWEEGSQVALFGNRIAPMDRV